MPRFHAVFRRLMFHQLAVRCPSLLAISFRQCCHDIIIDIDILLLIWHMSY